MSSITPGNGSELRDRFLSMSTPQDAARLLEVKYKDLIYYLFRLEQHRRYRTFFIRKKSGGVREISTPATHLKVIQRRLSDILQQVYRPRASVHGFTTGRSVVTNAGMHSNQEYVFNIDLKDFFPSINFGRVRGMFMAVPYRLNPRVATILAQVCCHKNELPQGAPTSPVVSNMICARMDSQLLQLAKKQRCIYTRYADDITFSTSQDRFPRMIAGTNADNQVVAGHTLQNIIQGNGFEINEKKVRLQTRGQRQEVTGLTANEFPNVSRRYVRQIRAMLHAWRKFGYESARERFWEIDTGRKSRSAYKSGPSFRLVVKGKIEFLGMVRGKDDALYIKLRAQYEQLT